MSTPSEKEPDLVELSDYLTHEMRESVSAQLEHPAESEHDQPRSPYAPKPPHERAAARLRLLAGDQRGDVPQPAPSEMRRRTMADQELARIEASLRQLQRAQGIDKRLPHGPNLPPPAERGLGNALREPDDNPEPVPAWFTRPRSLEPTIMPPPPVMPARKLHVLLSIVLACLAGALASYALMPSRSSQTTVDGHIGLVMPAAEAPESELDPSRSTAFTRAEHSDPEAFPSRSLPVQVELARTEAPEAIAPSPAAVISERHALAHAAIPAEEISASPAISSVPELQPEEIDALLDQGQKFMADGDIVTARLLFKRAAKAENATAALALAAAYDPIVLSKLGVLGVDTDIEQARLWYQKARELGATQAVERLRALAAR